MKLLLQFREPTWWAWLVAVLLLAASRVGLNGAFAAAVVLAIAQAGVFLLKHRSLRPYPVQIRVGYAALLCVSALPYMDWFAWALMFGMLSLILVGYCPLARMLSLMPWNRRGPLTLDLVRSTFFTPPIVGNVAHGLPARGCPIA